MNSGQTDPGQALLHEVPLLNDTQGEDIVKGLNSDGDAVVAKAKVEVDAGDSIYIILDFCESSSWLFSFEKFILTLLLYELQGQKTIGLETYKTQVDQGSLDVATKIEPPYLTKLEWALVDPSPIGEAFG